MPELNDWTTAPKDGSTVTVKFPDGETETVARWNAQTDQWEVPRRGKWAKMGDVHGANLPKFWLRQRLPRAK